MGLRFLICKMETSLALSARPAVRNGGLLWEERAGRRLRGLSQAAHRPSLWHMVSVCPLASMTTHLLPPQHKAALGCHCPTTEQPHGMEREGGMTLNPGPTNDTSVPATDPSACFLQKLL